MSLAPRLIRITTVPVSLHLLLTGQPAFFKAQGFEVLTISADGPDVEFLTQQGIAHRIVPMTRTIAPLRDLVCLAMLISLFFRFRPDIVHSHTPKAGLLGMLAAWFTRVPCRLHTVAGLPLMEAKGWQAKLLWFTEWLTYRCATTVYPNSAGLMAYLCAHFRGVRKKFSVIGKGSSNGIDMAHFSLSEEVRSGALLLRAERKIGVHDFVFCFVGRLVGDKGIHELVEAFTGLASGTPSVHLILAGHFEDERDPVRAETKRIMQTHERIHAVGFQADVRPWLAASDVFVFPSYREGFPNVVMQAACLGVACIASDINGCNELIRHGQSGWLVPPKQVGPLRRAMEEAIADAGKRQRYAHALREHVTLHYNRQAVWEALLAEYRKCLSFVAR
jgi:glycosyltransferase involved in cell wall biosynthesis